MNSRGFSLMEVMMALVVISAAIYLLSSYDALYQDRDGGLRRACQAHAEAVIGAVAQETYYRTIADFFPNYTAGVNQPSNDAVPRQVAPSTNQFVPTTAVPNLAFYWQGPGATNHVMDVIMSSGTVPQLHSNLPIQGSLRSLVGIYNNTPAVRCAFSTYTPLTGLPINSNLLARLGASVQMRLEPYNAANGQTACPNAAIYVAPPGTGNPETNALALDSADYTAAGAPTSSNSADTPATLGGPNNGFMASRVFPANGLNADFHNGMIMTVRVNYTQNGQAHNCTVSQRFEYPVDRTGPVPPNTAHVTSNGSLPGGLVRNYCSMGNPSVTSAPATIEVGYKGLTEAQRPEAGVQLLCKDLSWRRVPNEGSQTCRSGTFNTVVASNVPHDSGSNTRITSTAGSGDSDMRTPFLYTGNISARQANWVSCDQLMQCGQTPTVTRVYTLGATFNMYFVLNYAALPAGCVMNFEVVGVDTAGNLSRAKSNKTNQRTLRTYSHAPPLMNPGPSGVNWGVLADEIYYPSCGTATTGVGGGAQYKQALGYYCPAIPNSWAAGGFNGGYYKCDGSCN